MRDYSNWLWIASNNNIDCRFCYGGCCFIIIKHFFYRCVAPLVFLPQEIRLAYPGECQLWQSNATQPTVHAGCFNNSITHWTLTGTTRSVTSAQLLMSGIAHEGVQTPVRESALKVAVGKKSLAAQGNRTCVGGVPVRRCTNWATCPLFCILYSLVLQRGIFSRKFRADMERTNA